MRLALLVALLAFHALACSRAGEKKTDKSPSQVESAQEAPKMDKQEPEPVTYDLTPEQAAQIFESPLQTLGGEDTTLSALRGKLLLVVNVASQCGLTPQYEQLQAIHKKYEARGFSVVGFPCNQFGEQEPGTPEEILAFGKEEFGVTFPLMQKVETNGAHRHPIYQALTQIKDAHGKAGDVEWNFEKFLLSADGTRVTRFRPDTTPDDPQVITLLEAGLP
jgi:glutathione peroxidase